MKKLNRYKIKGMYRKNCVKTIESEIGKLKNAEDVSVNLDTGVLEFYGEVDNIVKVIADLGYIANEIKIINDEVDVYEDLEDSLKIRTLSSTVFLTLLLFVIAASLFNNLGPVYIGIGANLPLYFAVSELLLLTPIMIINWEIFSSGINSIIKKSPNSDALVSISTFATCVYGLYATYNIAFFGEPEMTHYLYCGFAGLTLTMVTLGRYIEANRLTEVSQITGHKSTSSQLADRVAEMVVPIIIVLAFISGFLWYFLMGSSLEFAFTVFITTLIVVAPCAITLTEPASIVIGAIKGVKSGIYYKTIGSIESANNAEVIVIDKTGVITNGLPEMTDFEVFNYQIESKEINFTEEDAELKKESMFEILLDIADLESITKTEFGDAVVRGFYEIYPEHNVPLTSTRVFKTIPGKGIMGIVGLKNYAIGNDKLMKMNDIKISREIRNFNSKLATEGKTSVFIAERNKIIGIIAVANTVREGAKDAIRRLQDSGHDVIMVSGEDIKTAQSIALKVGIMTRHVINGARPEDKARYVNQLKETGKSVAVVGSELNSQLMLAEADTKIAMGSGFPEIIEASDIIISNDKLIDLSKTLEISSMTIKSARQNLILAFIFNILSVPLAMGVLYSSTGLLMNPWIAWLTILLPTGSIIINLFKLSRARLNK